MPQQTVTATGQKFYNALVSLLAALPAGHPAARHIEDALASAAFGDYTPTNAAANYIVLESNGTITTYATASKAAMKTYVAGL